MVARRVRTSAQPEAAPRPDSAVPRPRCVICGALREPTARGPFCSERCKLIDLHRWLGESYRIPLSEDHGHESEDDEGAAEEYACEK
jgi:uncharacterized protein